MSPQQVDEKTLVHKASQGDKKALGKLYEQYVDDVYRYMLYRTSNQQVAEDLTSEVFASVITSIENYEERGLPFGAWLFSIAHARLVDHWRKTKPRERKTVTFSKDVEEFLIGSSPEDRFKYQTLLESLNYLTEAEREVILLRFAVGLSNQEIAAIVPRNSNAVKSMIYRALKKLRKILSERREFQEGYTYE
ncbi:MAG: RNA polymerase sigma factor [Anaerolineae bacterium]